MDVIYHGNCLDGCFSGLTMHIFLNLIANYSKRDAKDIIEEFCLSAKNNLKDNPQLIEIWKDFMQIPETLPEQFFIYPKDITYTSVKPGDFTEGMAEYLGKGKNKIIFLVDCSGQKLECLSKLAAYYKYIIIIDHHISADETLKLAASKHKNIFYFFGEEKCAVEYILEFLTVNFQFDKLCPKKLYEYLKQAAIYVNTNDLKMNETFNSKSFILYVYQLGLDLNHSNPLLFKRLANIDLELAVSKGRNLLPGFLKELKAEVRHPKLIRLQPFKIEFLGIPARNFNYVSDIGIILTRYGLEKGLVNLTMVYRYDSRFNVHRISFRSLRDAPDPLALKVAEYFGGGGHLCAAGCRVSKQKFSGCFKVSEFGVWEFQDAGMLYNKD